MNAPVRRFKYSYTHCHAISSTPKSRLSFTASPGARHHFSPTFRLRADDCFNTFLGHYGACCYHRDDTLLSRYFRAPHAAQASSAHYRLIYRAPARPRRLIFTLLDMLVLSGGQPRAFEARRPFAARRSGLSQLEPYRHILAGSAMRRYFRRHCMPPHMAVEMLCVALENVA